MLNQSTLTQLFLVSQKDGFDADERPVPLIVGAFKDPAYLHKGSSDKASQGSSIIRCDPGLWIEYNR